LVGILAAAGLQDAVADGAGGPLDLASYPRTELTITQGKPPRVHSFRVWVADTPQRAEQGLMFVSDLPESEGMVFPLQPPRVDKKFTATVCWFADETFTPAARYLVKCGTRSVSARIAEIVHRLDVTTLATEPAPETLKCNDIAQVCIALAQPLAFDAYEDNRATGAFILIDADTNATVAAGMIARPEDEPAAPDAAVFDAGL